MGWEGTVCRSPCSRGSAGHRRTSRVVFLSAGISAWSVSRTTFFFWLLWKLLNAIRYHRGPINFFEHPIPFSLLLFFAVVAISLSCPTFTRPVTFAIPSGCAHSVMIMDLFQDQRRGRWLFLFLALLPGLLTFRGILNDPSVLSLDLTRRLGFPFGPCQHRRLSFFHEYSPCLGFGGN